MIDRRSVLTLLAAVAALPAPARAAVDSGRLVLPDAAWKKRLAPQAYQVLRHEDTEAPFSSPLDHETHAGIYHCAGCDLALYSSKTKYDSGTGWPSFWAPLPHAVAVKTDNVLVEERTEVHCRRCDGHLGHVFDDGPPPTGKRYCMNGVAMKFVPKA